MTWSNSYNVSTNNVNTILTMKRPSDENLHFITIAQTDHFMNVFTEDSSVLKGSLRTENEIFAADLWSSNVSSTSEQQELANPNLQPTQTLLILNKDGVLEIFPQPFTFDIDSSASKSNSLKARMKQRSRKSFAQVRIVRSNQATKRVPLINACFQKDEIALAWVEGGINVVFDTVKWRDGETSRILLNGSTEITKEKSGTGLGAVNMNGVKDMGRSHVDDSKAVVANAMDADDLSMDEADPEVIDISSAEDNEDSNEEEEQEEEEKEEDDDDDKLSAGPTAMPDDVDHEKEEGEEREDVADSGHESMPDAEAEEESQKEAESPSFGDLLRVNAPEAINVSDALADGNTQSLVRANPTSLRALPSGMSLATVLTQSLRTNDTELLETCLHTRDLSTVRSTIERLDSPFASDLLQRLAERLHSRPGRAGSLMVWIQWTLVAHGGYLAGQPEVMRKLKSLHKVVKERAGSLQSLLNLKGKLDMLEAQMNLRKSLMGKGGRKGEEEEDDNAFIYVEGEGDDDEGEEDEEDSDDSSQPDNMNMKQVAGKGSDQESENEDFHDFDSIPNGIPTDADEVSASDEGSMAGEEPSETDPDSDEEELDNEDIDHASADDESSEGEASPAPTEPKVRLSNGVRSH